MIGRAAAACLAWRSDGVEKAAAQHNGRPEAAEVSLA